MRVAIVLAAILCMMNLGAAAWSDWPVDVWTGVRANPLIADINGDGKDEVVIATMEKQGEARIYVLDKSGNALPGWPKAIRDEGRNAMVNNDGPAAADFNNDGKQEICFATGWTGPGKLHLLDSSGNYLPGWPVSAPEKGIFQAPIIADIDGDGKLEIMAGGTNPNAFYAYEYDGTAVAGWPRTVLGAGVSAVTGDINGDGRNEIIAWTTGGRLYGWDAGGKALWPVKAFSSESITNCVLADVNGDKKMEITAGTGKGRIYIWDALTLNPLSGWEKPQELGEGAVRISLADMDRDGKPEIVAGFIAMKGGKYAGSGAAYVLKNTGTALPGWPRELQTSWPDASIAVADVDGDNRLELLCGTRDGTIHLWNSSGEYMEGYPKLLSGKHPLIAGPVLGDADGDEVIDAVVAYAPPYNKAFLVKFTGAYEKKTVPWPRDTYNNTNNKCVTNTK
ncbi:MAG: VCBS repeat-containing protein [bacterium]|nr:VCBS repeat-containing protein [bacterium]